MKGGRGKRRDKVGREINECSYHIIEPVVHLDGNATEYEVRHWVQKDKATDAFERKKKIR